MGYGSTYVLAPIAAYMKEKGFKVVEINPYYDKNYIEKIEEVKGKEIIFITSYHLHMDRYNYTQSGGNKNNESIAPLEIMEYLNPIKSVFYPHDLDEFMLEEELKWCNLFDVILVPYINNCYYKLKYLCPRVECVGWIKKNRTYELKTLGEECSPIYFPSNIFPQLSLLGVEGLAGLWDKSIDKRIPIKLHENKDLEMLSLKLRQIGFSVMDSQKTVFDMIEYFDLIIGNGVSTVIYEAALSGGRAISILDDIESEKKYRNKLKNFPNVKLLRYEEIKDYLKDLNKDNDSITVREDQLPCFDYERAMNLIKIG